MELNKYQQQIFDKITKNPDTRQRCVINGEHGVGKTTLLKALEAHYINHGKTVIFLDGQLIGLQDITGFLLLTDGLGKKNLSSETEQGWLQFRLLSLIKEKKLSDNLLIILDEMYCVSWEFAGYLRALIQRHNISMIVAAYCSRDEEYRNYYANERGYILAGGSPLLNLLGLVYTLEKME